MSSFRASMRPCIYDQIGNILNSFFFAYVRICPYPLPQFTHIVCIGLDPPPPPPRIPPSIWTAPYHFLYKCRVLGSWSGVIMEYSSPIFCTNGDLSNNNNNNNNTNHNHNHNHNHNNNILEFLGKNNVFQFYLRVTVIFTGLIRTTCSGITTGGTWGGGHCHPIHTIPPPPFDF